LGTKIGDRPQILFPTALYFPIKYGRTVVCNSLCSVLKILQETPVIFELDKENGCIIVHVLRDQRLKNVNQRPSTGEALDISVLYPVP
jgi:hypothetical protein